MSLGMRYSGWSPLKWLQCVRDGPEEKLECMPWDAESLQRLKDALFIDALF